MASVTKVAAFAGMVRVLVVAFDTMAADWRPVLEALAVLSLVGGALIAIVQTNVKRLLAYSSISHAGFILLGVQAASPLGTSAVSIYLIAYAFMVMGSFAVVTLVGRQGDSRHLISEYQGLGRSNPVLAGLFTLFLLAQAGIPFTAGFYAKLYAVEAAVDGDTAWLAIVAMLSAVIAAFLYLRLVVTMWFFGPVEGAERIRIPFAAGVALVACAVATLGIGLFPDGVTRLAQEGQPVVVRAEPDAAAQLPGELPFGDVGG
jgi:NADH-quinone oxidoreductase subunit N